MAKKSGQLESSTRKKRIYVYLTAFWGNDDVESTIKMSRRQWRKIVNGDSYQTTSCSYYEGEKFYVEWSFCDNEISIWDHNGASRLEGASFDELMISIE